MNSDQSDRDDEAVVRAVQQGDTACFEELVGKYQPRAYRIAYYYLQDQEEARDVAQEAFLLAFKHIGKFRGDAKFSTWFVRIVINLSLNRLRKRRLPFWERWKPGRRGKDPEGGGPEQVASRIPDPSLNPEQRALSKELGRKIQEAVDSLPEKQKAVFILRHLEGYSIKEICEATQMVEGTVKSYLSRAALHIQAIVGKYYGP